MAANCSVFNYLIRKEENDLLNGVLNTFDLWSYDVGDMVTDKPWSSNKDSFIYTPSHIKRSTYHGLYTSCEALTGSKMYQYFTRALYRPYKVIMF